MTNYEKILTDKKFLISLLVSDKPFWSEVLHRQYWCRSCSDGYKCPHYPECIEEGMCIDEHTDEEVAEMWLNEEYKEE